MNRNNHLQLIRPVMSVLLASSCLMASALNYDVNFTSQAPTIDGLATDGVWANASAAATGFMVYNDITSPSLQQTNVRLLWDNSKLYVMYEAADSDIVTSATGNDTGFGFKNEDLAEIYIDPSWGQHSNRVNRIYHIAVDAGLAAHTYTESGNGQLAWDLSSSSQIAVAHSGTNWSVEMAIAWSDLNSTASLSPGVVLRPPVHGTIWGAQFARTHSMLNNDNNTTHSKWNAVTSGSFRARPIGTLRFLSVPDLSKPDMSGRTINKVFNFEAPTYTDGNTVTGIENWSSAQPTIFMASSTEKFSGDQSLRIVASGTGRTLNNTTFTENAVRPQYVQYALRLPSEQINSGSYRHVVYLQGTYNAGSLQDALGQLWFRNGNNEGSNSFSIVSTEDPISETITTTTYYAGLQTYDNWMYVTVKVDPVEKKFEVWLNDLKIVSHITGSDKFGIRRKSNFVKLNYAQLYSKNFGVDPVYVDDITYYEDPPVSGVRDWQLF